jgi:NAD(P)H dehydrogenase (quinone)
MSQPLILIVGATGQIGNLLIDELARDIGTGTLRLAGLTRDREQAKKLAAIRVEPRLLDLDVVERHGIAGAEQALAGADRVFLLTGYDVKMLAHSKAIIDAAVTQGVQHIVHLGAHAAPTTTVVHLGWHQLIEAYIERSGLGFTHIQPTSLMQNIPMLFNAGGPQVGVLPDYLGGGRQSWADARDIAAIAAMVLRDPDRHRGNSYRLGSENLSMSEIAALLQNVTGESWRAEARTPERFLDIMTKLGADPGYMSCVANIFRRISEGTLLDLEDTFDTVPMLLGRPAITMAEYLASHRTAFGSGPRA